MSTVLVTTDYTRPGDEAAVASAGAGRAVGFGGGAGTSGAARGVGRLARRGAVVLVCCPAGAHGEEPVPAEVRGAIVAVPIHQREAAAL
ncbi:hypothetical protein OHS58_20210 [Amycolatopsis sp. NBC_00348]|uniref:hypothetical protein n=1 Tax=Amycolatopsis sp. NBC_00348 TaxID=2975956 RepID=UPI002E26011A